MENRTWDIFLRLLRAGLWERDPGDMEPLSAEDWDSVLRIATEQAVAGLMYRAMVHLPQGARPPAGIRMKLMAEADAIERHGAAAARVEAHELARYRAAGLEPIVKKGSRAARHYAFPELRSSGDIDLWCADLARARTLVPSAHTESDGSAVYTVDGITVELHPRYYDLHAKASKLPPVPSEDAELLLLISHILKHAMGAGIGLKQCCDLARALDSYLRDGRKLPADALRRAGIVKWYRLICSFLIEDLGLDPACLGGLSPCNAEPLRRIVRDGGNFGQAQASRRRALHSSAFARKLSTAGAFFRRLPFSLRYAPRETLSTIRELALGNFRK